MWGCCAPTRTYVLTLINISRNRDNSNNYVYDLKKSTHIQMMAAKCILCCDPLSSWKWCWLALHKHTFSLLFYLCPSVCSSVLLFNEIFACCRSLLFSKDGERLFATSESGDFSAVAMKTKNLICTYETQENFTKIRHNKICG